MRRAGAYKPKEQVTYSMIKEFIEEKDSFEIYTAEVERDLGSLIYDASNVIEK